MVSKFYTWPMAKTLKLVWDDRLHNLVGKFLISHVYFSVFIG